MSRPPRKLTPWEAALRENCKRFVASTLPQLTETDVATYEGVSHKVFIIMHKYMRNYVMLPTLPQDSPTPTILQQHRDPYDEDPGIQRMRR